MKYIKKILTVIIIFIILIIFCYLIFPYKSVFMLINSIRYIYNNEVTISLHGSIISKNNNFIIINNKYKPSIIKIILYYTIINDLKYYRIIPKIEVGFPNLIISINNKNDNELIMQILSFMAAGDSYSRCSSYQILTGGCVFLDNNVTRNMANEIILLSKEPENMIKSY